GRGFLSHVLRMDHIYFRFRHARSHSQNYMLAREMTGRILLLSSVFLLASVYITKAARPEIIPLKRPLAGVPLEIDKWMGQDTPDLDARAIAILAADDYLNRVYAADNELVGLFVGFYGTQRQGASIHSPLNCLPV